MVDGALTLSSDLDAKRNGCLRSKITHHTWALEAHMNKDDRVPTLALLTAISTKWTIGIPTLRILVLLLCSALQYLLVHWDPP